MTMKTIETDGITYIEPVHGATNEWYFGLDYEHGDLDEAEEIFREGHVVKGRKLCLVHYPDGQVFFPVPKKEGHYSETPVFFEGGIFIIDVDFPNGLIRIIRFDCNDYQVSTHAELPLSSVKDCYNLQLRIAPLTLQGKGYGKEVVGLLLDLAFNKLGALDFRYGYYQDNIRSKKVAEYFGFEYEYTYEMTRPWDGSLKVIDSCLLKRDKYLSREIR